MIPGEEAFFLELLTAKKLTLSRLEKIKLKEGESAGGSRSRALQENAEFKSVAVFKNLPLLNLTKWLQTRLCLTVPKQQFLILQQFNTQQFNTVNITNRQLNKKYID